jgi:hypothetical protein
VTGASFFSGILAQPPQDIVLARALASRMIHALRRHWRRGLLTDEGKAKGARVWALSPQGTA